MKIVFNLIASILLLDAVVLIVFCMFALNCSGYVDVVYNLTKNIVFYDFHFQIASIHLFLCFLDRVFFPQRIYFDMKESYYGAFGIWAIALLKLLCFSVLLYWLIEYFVYLSFYSKVYLYTLLIYLLVSAFITLFYVVRDLKGESLEFLRKI